ncbi:hypothetical protein CPB83DRAFT_896323 [Crepidotus variabilis]|uniref:Heat shock 70 kDa protein 12A n=1 Tax=Crepidotus variabilis TaxID=179855 RepID=A0A9P6JMI9_9AGAR|nr:hypothetical protein CPB83DRAFT_896323 [Crepidotus variabilis]
MAEAVSTVDVQWWYRGSTVACNCGSRAFKVADREKFKLHLRSKFGNSKNLVEDIPPLPPGKTVVEVIADFLAYLLECTATYIQDTHPNGKTLWQDFLSATHSPTGASNDGIDFVLSHPNGWEGKEQAQMRDAAVKAQLISDNAEGQDRISFVTEGEATLHFAVQNELLSHIEQSEGIVVVDAGGGTIDVSTYKRQQDQGAQAFEEISEARCYFHGSVFVTVAARNFLKKNLSESDFLDEIEDIISCFDKTTKLCFRDDQDPQYIKFGGRKDNDPHVNIRFGQMKLEGVDVATFFRASIDCIVQAVMDQKKKFPQIIRHVVLAGGFSASDWLFHKVRDILTNKGMTVIRPENNVVKAVSDGVISFYLDHYVRTRVATVTYGVAGNVAYDPSDFEHQKRASTRFEYIDGCLRIPGRFSPILLKGTQVKEEEVFSGSFGRCAFTPADLRVVNPKIICYRGQNMSPVWCDTDSKNFTDVFKLVADVSRVPLASGINTKGRKFYQLSYDVVIMFGLTELKAQLRWFENDVEKRSPAKLIYD